MPFDVIYAPAIERPPANIPETALTLPSVLIVAVGTFEFGRAYQTWQVLTNAVLLVLGVYARRADDADRVGRDAERIAINEGT